MPSHTIKVTGVSGELLELLDARIRSQHASGRAEYIRELIRKDLLREAPTRPSAEQTFRDMLAPVHEETRRQGYTEADLDALIEEARSEAYAARRAS